VAPGPIRNFPETATMIAGIELFKER